MLKTCRKAFVALFATLVCVTPPHAQETFSRDLGESVIRLPVSVFAAAAREQVSGDIPVTVFKPAGPGPFPLVVINHGRAGSIPERAEPSRLRFESAARFFVRKGFAVAVPTRLGYGETVHAGDPEQPTGLCRNTGYTEAMMAGAQQIVAVIGRLQTEPWVDRHRVVVMGQSVGGFISTAVSALRPAGLVAAINFAGGSGGDPVNSPGVPCSGNSAARSFETFGRTASAPMLWIYTENDLYFNPEHSRAWHAAFTRGGGKAEYKLLPAFRNNGHFLFAAGNDLWQPLVDDYLARFGFTTPGTLTPSAPSTFALLFDDARIPHLDARGINEGYRRFLEAPHPRAFALAADGHWGWGSGDDALSRALSACQRGSNSNCKLYAVDNRVVWRDGAGGVQQALAGAAPAP